MFWSGYIAKNTRLKQGERRLDENNIGGEGSLLAKNKWAKILLVVLFREKSKACKSTHFLSYDY